ncbi:hypothetical protein [Stenotrophomonas sp. P5_B8]
MASSNPAPEVVRIEVMDLDAGEVAVVAQLDQQPPTEWVEGLCRIVDSTPGMEEVAVRLDGYWLFFVGFGAGSGSAIHHRVAQLIASARDLGRGPRPAKKPRAASKKETPTPIADQRYTEGAAIHALQV